MELIKEQLSKEEMLFINGGKGKWIFIQNEWHWIEYKSSEFDLTLEINE